MADHGQALPLMVTGGTVDGRHHPVPELGALGLGLGGDPGGDRRVPGGGVGTELLDGHVVVEVGVVLGDVVDGDSVGAERVGEGHRRLLGPAHGADHHGIGAERAPPRRQALGLLGPLGGQAGIGGGVTAVDAQGQGVSDQPELHGRRW
ncbi:hypothetical protein BH23ACT2_BH23ACT2_26670 [soil metagenome]